MFRSSHKKKSFVGSDDDGRGCKLECGGGCTESEELELDISSSTVLSTVPPSTKKDSHRLHHHCADTPEESPEEEEHHDDLEYSQRGDSSRMRPMMARLDALQMQQKIQGMNHPDVLFSLRHLARAHRRRGEIEQARLVEEMLHAGQSA